MKVESLLYHVFCAQLADLRFQNFHFICFNWKMRHLHTHSTNITISFKTVDHSRLFSSRDWFNISDSFVERAKLWSSLKLLDNEIRFTSFPISADDIDSCNTQAPAAAWRHYRNMTSSLTMPVSESSRDERSAMTSFKLLKLLEELARDIPLEGLQHINDVTNMADAVLQQVLLPLASLALGGSGFGTGLVWIRTSPAVARVA